MFCCNKVLGNYKDSCLTLYLSASLFTCGIKAVTKLQDVCGSSIVNSYLPAVTKETLSIESQVKGYIRKLS